MPGAVENFAERMSLGDELRQCRERIGMCVEDVAREIKISARFVSALEGGDYHVFSARVYAQGTVRRMAKIFESADADTLVALCGREWDDLMASSRKTDRVMARSNASAGLKRFSLTPRRLGILAVAGFSLLLIAFLSRRLIAFAAPPALVVASPAEESRFATPLIEVTGTTEKESSLTVNGRELTLDERGNFDENIELPSGVNELQFISRNRFGKTQSVVRHIFVE